MFLIVKLYVSVTWRKSRATLHLEIILLVMYFEDANVTCHASKANEMRALEATCINCVFYSGFELGKFNIDRRHISDCDKSFS